MRKHLVEDFTGTRSAAKILSLCLDALRMKPEDISAADLADLRRWKKRNLLISVEQFIL
jgi:hypothetical protein